MGRRKKKAPKQTLQGIKKEDLYNIASGSQVEVTTNRPVKYPTVDVYDQFCMIMGLRFPKGKGDKLPISHALIERCFAMCFPDEPSFNQYEVVRKGFTMFFKNVIVSKEAIRGHEELLYLVAGAPVEYRKTKKEEEEGCKVSEPIYRLQSPYPKRITRFRLPV